MRAMSGQGLTLNLGLEDKRIGDTKGELTCRLTVFKKPQITLHIVDEVSARESLEEPGFHIESFPPGTYREQVESYDIYLSKKRWDTLVNPTEPPSEKQGANNGFFCSRCRHDRVHFMYWAV